MKTKQKMALLKNKLKRNLVLKICAGANWEDAGNEDTKDDSEYGAIMKNAPERYKEMDPTARAHFEKAAEAGDDLAVEWLTRVPSADHLSP